MIIKAKEYIDYIESDIVPVINYYKEEYNVKPYLICLNVGNNPASMSYIKNKQKLCERFGLDFKLYSFDENVEEAELLNTINILNHTPQVNGIIVQLPLPSHLDADIIINKIDPSKDVDGFTDVNLGKFFGRGAHIHNDYFAPATPMGIMELLNFNRIDLKGLNVCILGRSKHVTRPLAVMMTMANATVTTCHSKTEYLEEKIMHSDIIISAIGQKDFINPSFLFKSKNYIIIDVGINRNDEGKLCGDVNPDVYKMDNVSYTPVPGGVGPMTVCCLIMNTYNAFVKQMKLEK